MPARRQRYRYRPTLPVVLLLIFLGALWLAGGGSKEEVAGQAVVRGVSAVVLVVTLLFGSRVDLHDSRPVFLLLGASIALALLQLVPLPPDVWQALPGRSVLVEAAAASGQSQPWRPWSIVPGATVNAVASLIVPLAAGCLVVSLPTAQRTWLPSVILAFIAAAMFIGLLQFSGAGFNNPFVNDTPGEVSGPFANRNHFALLLATGCALAPVWALSGEGGARWRGPIAIGLVLLFLLTILASGSRAGLIFGVLGVGFGLLAVGRRIKRALSGYPRWVLPVALGSAAGLAALVVLVSVVVGRAVSIDRILSADVGHDMRSLGLPTVLSMIGSYFPAGSGLGGFDPVFRIHEPFALLKPTYFNHAHNDWLEFVLDTGLPGLLLLIAAVYWWARASLRAWFGDPRPNDALHKLGSAILLLVMGASVFDYPARTPTMMAVVIIAALWLGDASAKRGASALPDTDRDL